MAAAVPTRFHNLPQAAVSWNTGCSGSWTTPANWSSSNLPALADDVTINQPDPITVTLSSGTQSIHSLVDNNTLVLSAGTLAVSTTAQINGTFNLNGGTLQNATLSAGAAGNLTITSGTFSNVSLVSDLTLNAVALNTSNNLTVNSNLTLNSTGYYAFLYVIANETLSGNGTVLFNGNYSSVADPSAASAVPPLSPSPPA